MVAVYSLAENPNLLGEAFVSDEEFKIFFWFSN